LTLKNKIKNLLTGLTIPQEYICVELRDFQYPPSVFLELEDKNFSQDVTASHLFLGYKPLILGLSFNVDDNNYSVVKNQNQIFLRFNNDILVSDVNQSSLAKLVLKKIGEQRVSSEVIIFYEGERGNHSFLRPIHQWVGRQKEKRRKHSPDNISLPGNLVEQVRIAYSIPRIISVITTSDGSLVNLFPTDLHGSLGDKFYASSLRKGGKANDQVEKYGKIAISEVETSFYKQTYSLGKNHMQELKEESQFQLHSLRSKNFNFPLPNSATYYREMKRIDSFDHGIHRIHIYEIVHQQSILGKNSTLSHIHQYYTQWRLDHGLQTKIFLR
jgi:flavin reductase (DIM6/NTAB) family NADH-FMN oxidoreductase RutF